MKNKIIKNAIISGSMIVGSSGFALADMRIYSANVDRVQAEAKTDARYGFYQSGVSNERSEIVKGFGVKTPLDLTLKAIVPKGAWRIDMNEGAESLPVDWVGNTTWPYVLEDLARKNNLKISIDWSSRVVDVYSQDVADMKAVAAEKARIAAEKAAIAAAEKAANDKIAAEKAALLVAEKAAKAKADKEKALLNEKAVQERLAKANRIKAEKAAADKLRKDRLATDALLAKERAAADALLIKERAAAKAAADKAFAERLTGGNKHFSKLVSVNDRYDGTAKGSKVLTEQELFEKSNIRPIDGNMRKFIDDVYSGKFDKDYEAVFILRKGSMFSENLNMWTSILGWSFEKNSKIDYMITRDVQLKGNFIEVATKSVEFYKDSTKPLKLEPHLGNKVLEMKDFVFKSSEVGGERLGRKTQSN